MLSGLCRVPAQAGCEEAAPSCHQDSWLPSGSGNAEMDDAVDSGHRRELGSGGFQSARSLSSEQLFAPTAFGSRYAAAREIVGNSVMVQSDQVGALPAELILSSLPTGAIRPMLMNA